MEPFADAGCVLKVNVHCDACKFKMMQVLGSINGVYSVTIDATEGTANISGVVDPNILIRALAVTGRHAELVWANFKHPVLSNREYYDNSYASSHGYGGGSYNYGGVYGEPFGRHAISGYPWQYPPGQPSYYPQRRRTVVDYPYYNNYYRYHM